ncbi:thiamine pyrophosphate-requiring protein [Halobellus captivus]|uniref:thiamine pyrophosphate-requiring protein n=1 Tax=Halobellus captivus TaxID=2592614 RepID=UPI0011A59905|nr:thiamine pyrophosphate-requiring protein [Halobellus captivus]
MTQSNTATIEVGEKVIQRLSDNGVEHVFGTFGTDHPTLLKGLATNEEIKTIKAPHEMVAASAAHGYAQATGEPQVVLVHVDVGTANLGASVHNAARSRIPLFLMAGRTPLTSQAEIPGSRSVPVHYYQDVYDQHSLVSEYTKWEYQLEHGETAQGAVDRGLDIATSTPQGPVYLTMPREVLRYESQSDSMDRTPKERETAFGTVTNAMCAEFVSMLDSADDPLLVTSYLGRTEDSVSVLQEFAETAGVGVVESPPTFDMNFPHDHPLHLGFDPHRFLPDSDLVFVVNSDVPWVPTISAPSDETPVVHIDPDVGKEQYPRWDFRPDYSIAADPIQVLSDLTDHIRAQSTTATEDRITQITARHDKLERERKERLKTQRESDSISVAKLSDTLSQVIQDDTVIVAEPVSNTQTVLEYLDRSEPGTYYSYCMSGLGWGLGASLGIKLAKPESTVVSVVGDGSFLFGNPMAVIQMAQTYDLPHLLVVYNNRGWQAVDKAIDDQYGETAFGGGEFSTFDPDHTFAEAASGMGCHAERITDPTHLSCALNRGLDAVESGSIALLEVVIDREFPK